MNHAHSAPYAPGEGFGGLFAPDLAGMREPVLVAAREDADRAIAAIKAQGMGATVIGEVTAGERQVELR